MTKRPASPAHAKPTPPVRTPAKSISKQSTAKHPTTKKSTARSTTKKSTARSTTKQPTTKQPASKQPATKQPTTKQSGAKQSTTKPLTTKRSTTKKSTATQNSKQTTAKKSTPSAAAATAGAARSAATSAGGGDGSLEAARAAVDRRPAGVDDATVEATGKLSEALEWIERARGSLYEFHQKSGHADLLLGEAADALEEAGHIEIARRLREELVGRNVIEGRWTFQIVEEYDDTYWGPIRQFDQMARDQLLGGARHVFESEMKERRRTNGRRHHEARPADAPLNERKPS